MDCGCGTNANTAVAMCVGASRPGQWPWRWRAKWTVVIALLLGIFHPAQAADQVLVILSSDTPPYADFLAGLRSRLDSFALPRLTLQAVMASDYDQSGAWQTPATAPKLIVTVGTGAAEMLLHTPNTIPTVFTLIPKTTYDRLARQTTDRIAPRSHTAVFINQPIGRQLALIKLAFPAATRVGVLLGPTSSQYKTRLLNNARRQHLRLRTVDVSRPDDLPDAISGLSENCDVVLALPDKLIYNTRTTQNILLTTYRAGRPVVAYSQSFVDAGAVLGLFSRPHQIGHQVADLVHQYAAQAQPSLPAPQYPRYFSVAVNEYVARSLDLALESAASLTRRLRELEEGHP